MQKDKQFRVSGDYALASDGVQWVLQHRRGSRWDALKFIRSTKEHLAGRMQSEGVPPEAAEHLLAGLPDTFDDWLAAQKASTQPCHDDFVAPEAASMPETVK
jgi:hypothetical protein